MNTKQLLLIGVFISASFSMHPLFSISMGQLLSFAVSKLLSTEAEALSKISQYVEPID